MNKRIAFITSSFPFGKSEVWAINELNSLQELGIRVTIVPRTGKGKIINQDALKFKSNLIDLPFFNFKILFFFIKFVLTDPFLFLILLSGIIKQSNSINNFLKGFLILPKSLYLANKLNLKKIEHIHSLSTTSTATMAYIISAVNKVPWSYTLHSSSILNSKYKRSFLFQSRSASKFRTISNMTAKDLSNFIGPSLSKKIFMVRLGVNIKPLKKEKNFINNPLIISTPAELKDHKGHIFSINAAKNLTDMGISNFKWFFFGSGPLLKKLQKKVKKLNLVNHCYFPGNINHQELLQKYDNNEIDIVVSSSISIPNVFEGIPVSLLEAMSYEIPVIATDSGATRELVDGTSGILVNQNDSEAISNAIITFIDKPDYMRIIGKNGRGKVKQDFNTIKNTNDLIRIF